MNKIDRFWSHEAQNIRCVRESDYDQLRAELAALNAKLDASKFCANVADDLQAELAAIKTQEPVATVSEETFTGQPDCFESYRLADKFCEQRLVTDDHVRAIVVDAFASGYGFGIAAAPVAKGGE